MIDTKLILLEGLPSTGKSTNSSFILSQLNYNGIPARWIHEVARPHPTLYFYEACLDYKEYNLLIEKYPEIRSILESTAVLREKTVGLDLLELEWNYLADIGDEVFNEIKQHDVWNFSLERYMEVALEKWEHFVKQAMLESDRVNLLDSSIFQYQIFSFLLKNMPYESLEEFIQKLFTIISPLKPVLIYLCRERTEDTVAYLEMERGCEFMEDIWKRDQHEPYYENRPKGAQGYREFLLNYGKWAYKLFKSTCCPKICIDITKGTWSEYEHAMLEFLGVKPASSPEVNTYVGVYRNECLGFQLEVNGLTLTDPNGTVRRLIPKAPGEFYVQYLPTVLKLDNIDKIVISGEQICERWTTSGMEYSRVG